ncbi:MAG: hypothetical protein ACRDBM_17190 [Sporomusa sp.]
MMDLVAQPLSQAICKLEQHSIKYQVTVTKPSRPALPMTDEFYVIRQQIGADGVCVLVVANKMGKEVF